MDRRRLPLIELLKEPKKTLLLAKSDCVEMIVVRWVLNAIDHVSGHFYLVALFYGKC